MRRLLAGLTLALIVLAALSCGGGGGDDEEDATEFPEDTFGIVDGRGPDGTANRPIIELWQIPGCTCDELITNTLHGTRVRLLRQKEDCPGAPIEVELLDGDKAGTIGWVWPGRWVTIDGETPEPSPGG
jgi:hypothetical protein